MASSLQGKVVTIGDKKYRVSRSGIITSGKFSTVYEGSSDSQKTSVAIKHMAFNTSDKAKYEAYVKEETILDELRPHKNIVQLIDKKEAISDQDMDIILVLEYCISNLSKIITNRKKKGMKGLPEQFILKILSDVTRGISYLHQSDPPIIHRDIRVDNILLGNDSNYKICNFGNCTKKVYNTVTKEDIGRVQSEISNFTSREYRAPEQLDLYSGYPIGVKLDSWALGVVLYQMMYFKHPFREDDPESQAEAIISYPQTNRYSIPLQKLVKKLLEKDPANRPSANQALKFIENIQSSFLSGKPSEGKNDIFSNADEEERKRSDSSEDEGRRYKTAQSEEELDDTFYKKGNHLDTTDRDFRGFATKVVDTFSNGTKGWVRYATDNSSFPPKIQFLAKLVLKAWRKRDKVSKFYKNLDTRGFGDNTIISLKSLSLLHKYMLCGPSPQVEARGILVKIYESWAGNIMRKRKNPKDEYRSDNFNKLICTYAEILIAKYDLFAAHHHLFTQCFNLDRYFKNRESIDGSPLALKVIRALFNYWKQLTGIHHRLTNTTYLRKIVAFIAVSIVEEEYPLVCLITHLYHAFKTTVFVNGQEHKLKKDMEVLDDKFIKNYASTYLFYQKVIRIPELQDVRPKLPYFPISVLKHFQLNSFLNDLNIRGDKNDITTFLSNSNDICGLKIPAGYESARLIILSEFTDDDCHFEPFKNFRGGDRVLRDCKIPCPSLDSILQSLPSKRKRSKERKPKQESQDVRLDIEDDSQSFFDTPFILETNKSKPLQGQGEEVSITDDFLSNMQKVIDNPNREEIDIFQNEDSKAQERNRQEFNLAEDLVDFGVNPDDNLIDLNKNKSAPRRFIQPNSGFPVKQGNHPYNHPSNMMPGGNLINFGNCNTPLGQVANYTQKPVGNFPGNSHLGPQRNWNSVHKQNLGGIGAHQMPMNPPQKSPIKNESSPFSFDKREESKNFVSEDWFDKIGRKDTVKATDGTKEVQNQMSQNDSFLIELTQPEKSSIKEPESSIADLIDLNDDSQEQNSEPSSAQSKNSESKIDPEDFQRELAYIEKQKELQKQENIVKEAMRQIEQDRLQLEKEKREAHQINCAKEMRVREAQKKLSMEQANFMKYQRMGHQREQAMAKAVKEKHEEEKKNKKTVLEDHHQLKMDDFSNLELIGSGGSAKVYKCLYKQMDVAIKRLDIKSISADKARIEFRREVNTLSKIRHPNLVLFIGVAMDSSNFCIATEYCFGGSLFELLHNSKDTILSWSQKLKISKDVALGMGYLHNHFDPPILHRDLKSLNLLLSERVTGPTSHISTKITDFGLSRETSNDMMTENTGTYHWMAPEIMDGKKYTYKADVYSFAICLYEIITRRTPYPNMSQPQIVQTVTIMMGRPDMSVVPPDCPEELVTLMVKCWDQNPDNRPGFEDIIKVIKAIET